MNINLRDGIFLGKEELLRIRDFQELERDSKNFLFDSGWDQNSRYGVYANSIEVDDLVSTMEGYHFHAKGSSGCGRSLVGFDKNGKIALPSAGTFVETSEAFLPKSQLSTVPSAFNVVYLTSATTNYEKALATIGSDGTVTINKGWSYVSHLFRTTASGKPSLIKTEGGQLLTVTEVREASGVGYLTVESSTAITEEEDVRFMFMQTISPFSSEEPQPLYIYSSSVVGVKSYTPAISPIKTRKDACKDVFDDGKIPIAIWQFELLVGGRLELLTPDYFTEAGSYTLLDTVRDSQITNRHIKDGTIAESKLAFNAHGFGNYVAGQIGTTTISPNSICVMSTDAIAVSRKIKIVTPTEADLAFCVTHPSRVIWKPQSGPYSPSLRTFFDLSSGDIDVLFDFGSEVKADQESYEIFDIYWVSTDKVLVMHKKYSINE